MNWLELHGTHALLFTYGVVAISTLAGLIKGRAHWSKFLWWPFIALNAMILCVLLTGLLSLVIDPGPSGTVKYRVIQIEYLVIFMVLSFFAGLWIARRKLNTAHQRGSLVLDGAAAQKSSTRNRLLQGELPVALAGIAVRPEDETKHFKLIGTTGTGKSTAIRALLADALERGDRAVIADPDGGYLSRFYDPKRGDVLLNPFDARSRKWDIYGEVKQSYDIEQLARSLIPDGESASGSEWRGYARTFFAAVMKQSRLAEDPSGAELFRLLTAAPDQELRILLEGTPAQPFLAEGNYKMFASIRSVTAAAVGALAYIEEQASAPLSVRDWAHSGRGVLFIPYRADQIAALRDLIATWVRLAIFQTMSEAEGDHKRWFVVDELDALGRIDGLKDALARLRKFGGRCVLGFQSIGQVSSLYGQGDAQTIVENCGNTAIFRCSASEGGGTARFASKLIGEREVIRHTTSTSEGGLGFFSKQGPHKTVTTSEHHAVESAVMASEIEQLADGMGFVKFASSPEWLRVRFPIHEQPKVADAFVARP